MTSQFVISGGGCPVMLMNAVTLQRLKLAALTDTRQCQPYCMHGNLGLNGWSS
jgi:hypothetical protein